MAPSSRTQDKSKAQAKKRATRTPKHPLHIGYSSLAYNLRSGSTAGKSKRMTAHLTDSKYNLRARKLVLGPSYYDGPIAKSNSTKKIIPLGHSRTELKRIINKTKEVLDLVEADVDPMPSEDIIKYTIATTVKGKFEQKIVKDVSWLSRFIRQSPYFLQNVKMIRAGGIKNNVETHALVAMAARELFDMEEKVEERLRGTKVNKPYNAAETKAKRDKFNILMPFWIGVVSGYNLDNYKTDKEDSVGWRNSPRKIQKEMQKLKDSTDCVLQ